MRPLLLGISTMAFLLAALLAVNSSGCGGPAPLPPIAFFNVDNSCNSQQKSLLETTRTTVFVPNFVQDAGDKFDSCMRDAFISSDKGLPVERILGLMREPFNTSIGCKDNFSFPCAGATAPVNNWAGCAGPFSPGSNALNLSHEFLCGCAGQCNGVPCTNPAAAASIAGVILHEIAHNKNFDHDNDPYEVQISVNQQLNACINGGPFLARRSSLTREVELAHIGGHGGGGNPSESFCGNAFVTGLLIASDTVVRSVEPVCAFVGGGTSFTAPLIGSSSPSAGSGSVCPTGLFVTGFLGNNGDLVDRIGVSCSTLPDILNGTSGNTPQTTFGGGGGLTFQRQCPAGMAVVGFQSRSDVALDQLRPVCRQIGVGEQRAQKLTQVVGKMEGKQEDLRCTGQGAMIGIYGRAGTLVDRVGGICHSLQQTAFGLVDAGIATEHATAAGLEASSGGSDFQDRCAATFALVGFSSRSGDSLDQLTGICAGINQWATGASATNPPATCTTRSSPSGCTHGGSGGSANPNLMCPPTEFVVGLETWRNEPSFQSGVVVRGFHPVCRQLPLPNFFAQLVINKVGAGQVSSNTFTCDPTCLVSLNVGSSTMLTATPSPAWVFSHWEGACAGSGTIPTCSLGPLVSNTTVTAVFVPVSPTTVTLNLTVASVCPAGASGVVTTTPSVVTCQVGDALHPATNTCSVSLPAGTALRFRANPISPANVSFAGGCTSPSAACPQPTQPPLSINANTDITAKFCGLIQ